MSSFSDNPGPKTIAAAIGVVTLLVATGLTFSAWWGVVLASSDSGNGPSAYLEELVLCAGLTAFVVTVGALGFSEVLKRSGHRGNSGVAAIIGAAALQLFLAIAELFVGGSDFAVLGVLFAITTVAALIVLVTCAGRAPWTTEPAKQTERS